MLLSLIIIPLVAALVVPLVAKQQVRWLALLATLAPLVPVAFLLASHPWFAQAAPGGGGGVLLSEKYGTWVPDLGIAFNLRADGVSMALIALTALLGPLCVLGSWTAITRRVRTFYGWLLVLQSAMYAVFAAQDLVVFYIAFEFTLVPMFVLISLFGSTNRKAAAIKFFLYTFTGSIVALAGLVYVAWYHAHNVAPGLATSIPVGGMSFWTFDIPTLMATARLMPAQAQMWVFAAMMIGFAVKVPLFPLHTWLPLAHTEAPTAGSVVLAGVLLKLGTYAIYTFALGFVPLAALQAAPFIGALAIAGILVGGLICWVQTDVKKLVAYSSVAHLGFCMLGMFALNTAGLQGALLYMINHGLSTGALFLCIGFMYERYHTRSMHEIGGLASRMPIWATFMVFFAMASVGLPGLNGFVSEFLCVMGAYQADARHGIGAGMQGEGLGPKYALLAGSGMIIGAIYILYMVGKVVWGPLVQPAGHDDHDAGDAHGHGAAAGGHAVSHAAPHGALAGHEGLPRDLTGREIVTLLPLAALCLFLGVYPRPLMEMVMPSVREQVTLIERTRAALPDPLRPDLTRASPRDAGEPAPRTVPSIDAPDDAPPAAAPPVPAPRH